MSKETNEAALGKFAEAVNTGKFGLFDEVVAPTAIEHDPAAGQVNGPQGYRSLFKEMRSAFPDMKVELDTMVADDDAIAFAYTFTGTQNGPLMSLPPTGRKVKIRGMQISRFKDGKMVERWGSSDELGLLKQLGAAVSRTA